MARQNSREIDAEAADWAARVDRAPLSPQDQQALDAWLDGDIRRVGAYAKARGIALHSARARALAPNYDPQAFTASAAKRAAPRPRRRWLWAGAAIAASLAGVIAIGVWPETGDRYNTRRGEVRVVPMADGSVITLNTDSQVIVRYTSDRRDIQLVQGEALFDVAKDKQRPFVVEAGDTQVRAIGTSFTVSRLADAPVRVLVREGVVEVNERALKNLPPVRVSANMQAEAAVEAAAVVAEPVAPADIGRELAWREGRIAFEGETLQQAAEQFARYSNTRIVIDDPAVAAERITGLFQANDPVGFSRAVATSLGLQAQVGAEEVRLHR